MDKKTGIGIGIAAAVGIAAFLIYRSTKKKKTEQNQIAQRSNEQVIKETGELLSITTNLSGKPSFAGGLLNKRIMIPVQIDITNRTANSISLHIPSIKLLYNNNQVGDIVPNAAATTIQPYATTPYNVTFDIPVFALLGKGIASSLLTSGGLMKVMSAASLVITTTINGQTQQFARKMLNGVMGLGLVSTTERTILSKGDYTHLIAPASALGYNDKVIVRNIEAEDTPAEMIKIINSTYTDTTKLAKQLHSNNLHTFCENIWDFVATYIKYEPDSRLYEQLRRPLRTLHDQKGDCDCYSILIASILKNYNIPYKLRIAEYSNKGYFQHVYVVVPTANGEIIIDPVVDKFNWEKPYTRKKDFNG